jgi:tetratricopeptide (TPR) repeat protein
MKRAATLAAAGLFLSGLTYACTKAFRAPHTPAQAPAAARPPFASEQAWLTSEIAGTIWNISAFTAGSPIAPNRPVVTESRQPSALAAFTVEVAGRRHDVAIADYFWSPSPFVPIARALMPEGAVDHAADATDTELLTALTNPRADVIQAQNVRLSALLHDHPRSSALHERAALLVGALALRENAATMSDPRLMMCRMTAHLAVARALDSDGTRVERGLAEAVLLALVNRQRDGVAAADRLPRDAAPAAIATWQRALKVRLTKDWRQAPDVAHASLLEQRETVRAVRSALNEAHAVELVDQFPADVPDWGRILFHQTSSVGTGGRFADEVVGTEIAEARRVRAAYPDAPGARDLPGLVRELNVEPSTGPALPGDARQFWIIDWGTWAASAQRHVIAGIVCRNRHYWVMLALPGDGATIDRQAAQAFGDLRLYPLALPYVAKNANNQVAYTAGVTRAALMARERPDLVTDGVLTDIQERPFDGPVVEVPPNIRWFNPYFPVGTGYEPHRVYRTQFRFRVDLPELERLRSIAPYERTFLSGSLERRFGLHPPLDVVKTEAAEGAAYDLGLAWMIARAAYKAPDVYVPTLRHIAETMNPDDYHYLGEYLAEIHRDAEAEAAYKQYIAVTSDPVAMTHQVWWLVLHYFETGRRADALALAEHAADVYSGPGLIAYGNVLDMSGDPRRAEGVYRQVQERYDNAVPLLGFLLRHPERNARGEAERLTATVFPSGMQKVATPPATAPETGVLITWTGLGGEREGLRDDDVIVAIDGVRVANEKQYNVVKNRTWSAPMQFLVWRGKEYVSVDTQLRHRWVASRITNYPDRRVWR